MHCIKEVIQTIMDNNSFFEDDFNLAPGAQPSGHMHIADAPDLSRSLWYDLENEEEADAVLGEDEDIDGNDPFLIAASNPQLQPTRPASVQTLAGGAAASVANLYSSPRSRKFPLYAPYIIITLIVIVALLGGFAFARTLSPSNKSTIQSATGPIAQQTHTKSTVLPTTIPATMPVPGAQNLPVPWVASERGTPDMFEALSVAETFTQRYETIDFRSPATLTASSFILTNAAINRFAAQDKRHTDAFAAQVQQQKLMQAVLITGAQLVQAQNQNGRFFAWVTVSYQFVAQQGQGTPTTLNNQTMTVLLVAAQFDTPAGNPPMGGIGWQVSNFGHGNTLPAVPATP